MYPRDTLPERQKIGLATINKDDDALLIARRDYAAVRICNEIVKSLGSSVLPLTPDQRAEIIALLDGHHAS